MIDYGIAHHRDTEGKFRDSVEVAREKADWILDNNHHLADLRKDMWGRY
jgi:hypothetical protein